MNKRDNHGDLMHLNLMDLITIIGAIQGLFLAVSFFLMEKGAANKIIALLLFTISFSIGSGLLKHLQVMQSPFSIEKLNESLQFLFGPLLLLYIKITTDRFYRIPRKDLIHCIPFFLYIILFSIDLIFISSPEKQLIGLNFNEKSVAVEFISNFHMCLYLILSLNVLKKYRNRIKDNNKIDLSLIVTGINFSPCKKP